MKTDIDNIIADALELINKDDFQSAKELLYKALESSETSEIYKNIGLCELNLDNTKEATQAFKKAYELDNQDATTTYYYGCCLSKTDKQKAAGLFEEVIKLRKDFSDAYKSLAMVYMEINQTDNAIQTVLSALSNKNIEPDYSLYYIAATCYMIKKDYENAIKYLEKALEIKENHLPVINSLATCYMNTQNYEKALEILKKAYEADSENSLTLYNLGICYQVKSDFEQALKYFQEAYKIEPTTTILSCIANCALKSANAPLASSLYQNLISAYPNNLEYRYAYIEALEMMGNFENALENVNILLSYDEKNVALTKKKGTYLRKLRRNEESIEAFTNLLNRGKIDIEVYYNLAFNYTVMGDFDNAKEMFKKCIILEPNNPYAHKDLGVLYLKMNCYNWALEEMKEAVALEDDVSEFHYSLGVSYMMLSDMHHAKEEFLYAIKLDNQNADAIAYLGYIYLLEKDYDNSVKTLKQALSIDPDNFLAKSHSAKLYMILEKYEVAGEFLADLIEKTQDDETTNMLAVCYMRLEKYDKAMGLLYKLAQIYPKNHIILTNLAKCEHLCGRKKEALDHIRRALLVYDNYDEALKLLEELENA